MSNQSKRKLQLVAGFTVFIIAVIISYFSVVEDSGQSKQDVFLVMDVSGSMADDEKLYFAKNAAFEFIDALNLNNTLSHQVGLIAFSDVAYKVVDITQDHDILKQGISSLNANGGTAMGDGIESAASLLIQGRPDAGKTIVLLSDGVSNTGTNPLFAAHDASSLDVRIFSVGYGWDADVATLRGVASVTNGEYFDATTGHDLAQAFVEIAESIISPVSHYSSRVMMLLAIPILLFIPAIEAGITTMMGMRDAPVQRNVSKRPCPYCQHSNRSGAKFCLKCGKSLNDQTPVQDKPVQRNMEKRPCPYCQHSNRSAAKFCLKCGKSMKGEKT